MSQTTTKAGIHPANQPKSNQPKRQSERERFQNAPAIKCRVEMQASTLRDHAPTTQFLLDFTESM